MIELAFLHIPKTAGRTLVRHLGPQYPEGAIANVSRDALRQRGESVGDHVTSETRVIAGHLHFRDVEGLIGPETKIITFLREPVERVLSHYFYNIAVEFPRQRREMPLRLMRRRLGVTRSVKGSALKAMVAVARRPQLLLEPLRLSEWIELESSRDVACRVLDGCPLSRLWFVGFQERFTQDLHRLAGLLDWKIENDGLAVNVNPIRPPRSDVPEAIRQRIWVLNEGDRRLYREAAELWSFPVDERPTR